jgi:hypothetical protein
VVYDVLGPPGSVLHLFRAALSRVPFEAGEGIVWRDYLPRAWLGGRLRRWLFDFVSPFVPTGGVEMEYRFVREGRRLEIVGASTRTDPSGEPLLRTRAALSMDGSPAALEVTAGPRRLLAERAPERAEASPAVAPFERWALLPRISRSP